MDEGVRESSSVEEVGGCDSERMRRPTANVFAGRREVVSSTGSLAKQPCDCRVSDVDEGTFVVFADPNRLIGFDMKAKGSVKDAKGSHDRAVCRVCIIPEEGDLFTIVVVVLLSPPNFDTDHISRGDVCDGGIGNLSSLEEFEIRWDKG